MESQAQADEYYKKGLELKASGRPDLALTEFRRAVLADPNHALSHLEVGLLSKSKADSDPYFLRFAFEAFRHAARLDQTNEQAHDQYIMLGHKMGLLDELHSEYEALAKAHPDNPNFQRCAKNIVTLSMALLPDQVTISGGDSKSVRKILLIASLGLILFGVVLAFVPVVANKLGAATRMEPSMARRFLWLGFTAFLGGIGGFFLRARF